MVAHFNEHCNYVASNCFDDIALHQGTQFHGHFWFNYIASHICHCIPLKLEWCRKIFPELFSLMRKIFSCAKMFCPFSCSLARDPCSRCCFVHHLDFARCHCEQQDNGALLHFLPQHLKYWTQVGTSAKFIFKLTRKGRHNIWCMGPRVWPVLKQFSY